MKVFSYLLIYSYLVLYLLISVASTRKVQFSLITFGKNVKVNINGTTYLLNKYNSFSPLFRTTIDVNNNDSITYRYLVDEIYEDFERTLAFNETTTHNEFFGRKITVKELPQFPTLDTWTKSIGKTELFDDSYIPTVYISGENALNFFKSQKPKVSILEKIVFILKDSVHEFTNIQAAAKNLSWAKFQFKVALTNGGIHGRYVLKFRDNNEDPTFMRQDLYGDILNALGYPTIQSIKARVYVEGLPVGYYILQEEAPSNSFVRSAFHGNNNGKLLIKKIKKLGYPIEADTGADFFYTGNKMLSSYRIKDTGHGDTSKVIKLLKAFEKLNAKNDNEIKEFEQNWFDIDTFLKAIAMQYLTGSYDSYWFFTSNFALYDDPTQSKNDCYKFYFICQDWDATFGIHASKENMQYDDYYEHTYKDYVNNKKWGTDGDSPQRYAVDKLFQNANVRTRFETLLINIVKNIFNPNTISKRLDALVERHNDEIKWNYDVIKNKPLRKGKVQFDYNDFITNIEEGVVESPFGIKQFVYLRANGINKEFKLNLDLGKAYNIQSKGTGCQSKYGQCNNEKKENSKKKEKGNKFTANRKKLYK